MATVSEDETERTTKKGRLQGHRKSISAEAACVRWDPGNQNFR